MKNYEWKRISESHEDSSHTYRYACEDFPGATITELESRGIEVYRGSIWQHDFIVEDRDSGYKKVFGGPIAAKRFVERGQLEKAIKAKRLEKAIKAERPALAERRRTCDG